MSDHTRHPAPPGAPSRRPTGGSTNPYGQGQVHSQGYSPAQSHPSGGPSISRSLFKSQLTRRPTPSAPGASSDAAGQGSGIATGATGAAGGGAPGQGGLAGFAAASSSSSSSRNNSAETLRLPDIMNAQASAQAQAQAQAQAHSHGQVPRGSDASDIVVRDKHGEIEIGDLPMPGALDEADEGVVHDQEESKRERQRLADAVKQHQVNHPAMPDQPEELLEAVKRSLKAKVAALEEDQWMFEPGDPTQRR